MQVFETNETSHSVSSSYILVLMVLLPSATGHGDVEPYFQILAPRRKGFEPYAARGSEL